MARRDIDVRLGSSGVPVGTLIADQDAQRETSMFHYAQTWLENPRAFALSLFLPLRHAPFFFRKERHISSLPSPVEDGAPDSWGHRIIDKTSVRLGQGRSNCQSRPSRSSALARTIMRRMTAVMATFFALPAFRRCW